MVSKFKKFATGATLLSVMLANSNAHALSDEGMSIGIDLGMPFAVMGNKDFTVVAPNTPAFTYDQKRDGGFMGAVTIGFTLGDGIDGGLQIGYFNNKLKDSVDEKSTIEATNMFAMAVGKYYLDMDSFYPFVGVGVGGARVNVGGKVTAGNEAGKGTTVLDFTDMIGYTFAYSAQIGVAMEFSPVVARVSYQLLGFGALKEGKDYSDSKVTTGATGEDKTMKPIKFGKFSQIAHMVTIGATFVVG